MMNLNYCEISVLFRIVARNQLNGKPQESRSFDKTHSIATYILKE